jgi:anti-anti-sigma regulatory factor
MSVQIVVVDANHVHATISGDFNFESSRALLLGVKKCWQSDGGTVLVHLWKVTRTTSCAIGAMAALAEMAGKNFHLSVEQCANEVHALFDSGLLDRYFKSDAIGPCRECLERLRPACEMRIGNPTGAMVMS